MKQLFFTRVSVLGCTTGNSRCPSVRIHTSRSQQPRFNGSYGTSVSGSIYTTSLYYSGTLIAAISANTTNWETTFYDYVSNQQWTSTSPSGLLAGQTWNMAPNASGTADSSGTQLNGVCGGATGYFYYAVDSTTGDYYSEHYHPSFYSTAQRTGTRISSGGVNGGNPCPKSGCLNSPILKGHGHIHTTHGGIMHPDSTFNCVTGIVGTAFGALGMAASVVGLFSGALTPLAVGGLIGAHITLLWGIAMIYAECM